ncbi:MAG: metalloregulator ArsR/SmtB family transcription factor [Pseudomonadota bacterium]
MHAFDVLADPVRRRTLELIAKRERTSGEIVDVIEIEFGITQSAVSQHLRVLRESGFASVRHSGTKRNYSINSDAFFEIDAWLNGLKRYWSPRLEALATEVERGQRRKPE